MIRNARHPKKKNTAQNTPLLYGTRILAIKIKIFTRSGKLKKRTLKILLDYGTSATIIPNSLIPKARHKKNTKTKWDTLRGIFQTQDKANVLCQTYIVGPYKNYHVCNTAR